MKQLNDQQWMVTREDQESVTVTKTENSIQFKPCGAVHPIRFYFGTICGCVNTASFGYEIGDRGGCAMTHEQCRQLLAFLKEYEEHLTDPAPKEGDVHEWHLD